MYLFTFIVCAISTKEVFSWTTNNNNNNNILSRRDSIITTVLVTTATVTSIPPSAIATTTDDENSNGYILTSRGLKYKVTKAPDDPNSDTPTRAQKVKAKYTLYLNGFPEDTDKAMKVDSSNGLFGEKPFEFYAGVSQVIKGVSFPIIYIYTAIIMAHMIGIIE